MPWDYNVAESMLLFDLQVKYYRTIMYTRRKMIIVQYCLGLGNQMFQHALVMALRSKGYEVKADSRYLPKINQGEGALTEIEAVFGISLLSATTKEIMEITALGGREGIFKRLKCGFLNESERYFKTNTYENYVYLPSVFDKDNVYLQGHWFSEKYFTSIEDQIKTTFTFSNVDRKSQEIANDYLGENSISVHVRVYSDSNKQTSYKLRGYAKRTLGYDIGTHTNAVTKEYYRKAKKYFDERIIKPKYHIFTNNIQWCINNLEFNIKDYVTVNHIVHTTRKSGYLDAQYNNPIGKNHLDMYLMSQCKHHIVSNSSFAWWGAWLDSSESKIVLCPDRWFTNGYGATAFPDSWIRVSAV